MSVAEAFPLGGSVGRLRPQTMGLCGEPPRAMVLKLGPPQDGRSDPTRLSLRVASGDSPRHPPNLEGLVEQDSEHTGRRLSLGARHESGRGRPSASDS